MAVSATPKLSRPGDPLILRDGRIIKDPKLRSLKPTPPALKSHEFKASAQRSIKDLPANAGVMNAVSTVLVYTLLGISNREIGDILRLTVDQVLEIKAHTAYSDTFEVIKSEFINENSGVLQSRIAALSHEALTTVADIMTGAQQEETRLRAATDILDRSGARPVDIAAKKTANANTGVRIQIIDGEKETKIHFDPAAPDETPQ